MPWNDRLREAAYTSPSGVRTVFDYENVQREFDKRTTAFNFPDADGTFIQDMGHTGRRYPLRVIFWGDDHDLQSADFETALFERGVGKLEHPLYGTIDVVPFGKITTRDDLKRAANQSITEVTFWETINLVYPTSQLDPASEVLQSVDGFNSAVSVEFEGVTDLSSAVEQASFFNAYDGLLTRTNSVLRFIADTEDAVNTQYTAIYDSISNGLDLLIDEPELLAAQTTLFVQSPARAQTSITPRLDAYTALGAQVIANPPTSAFTVTDDDKRISNAFHASELYVMSYVTGSIVSVVNNTFNTKAGAIEAAEVIIAQFAVVTAWRDENYADLNEIDTGASYQKLQEAVALTVGFLVEISFTLKQERTVTLDRNRTIVDLVGELYGAIDSELDFFIASNDLSGSEIIELPKGREIVYYI